jgi:hypothetical protein
MNNLARRSRDLGFKVDEVMYLDRKSIQIDRMLLNLFELLRFDGQPAVRRRTRTVDIDGLIKLIEAHPERFPGFDERPEIARAWLMGDLLEIMNRNRPGREMVVGPRPFHLNAFKLANPKAVRDYRASQQVWAMLYHADRPLLARLKEFFGRGVDPASDRYDGSTLLDLETLAVLGLVDQVDVYKDPKAAIAPIEPLCTFQGRLMADDLRRLLVYEIAVPRHVLAGYVRTVIGLHLGLFVLRLVRLLPDWVEGARRGEDRPGCLLDCGECADVIACPYQSEIVVDLTEDPASPCAAMARDSAASYIGAVSEYVRAVIVVNRLKDFANIQSSAGKRPQPRTVDDILEVLARPPTDMDGFFQARIADLRNADGEQSEDPTVESLMRLSEFSSFDTDLCARG